MTERVLPDWAADNQEHVIWLDDDNAFTWTYAKGESEPSGGLHWHRRTGIPAHLTATPGWCVGGITFGGTGWTLESKEPLTVSPSLLCRSCGSHGFIRDGKWVQA
jgi:hypothetical protein